MYKILALDCDNTLLSTGDFISEKNKQALKDLKENHNVRVVLVSGRGPKGMYRYIEELGLEDEYHIANNGTNIFKLGKEVRETAVIEREEYLRLIDYLHENKIDFMSFEKDYLVYDTAQDMMKPVAKYLGDSTLYEGDPKACTAPFKVGIYYRNEAEHKKIMEFDAKSIDLHQADRHFVDVNTKGISKMVAIKMMAAETGVNEDEISTAGDNENDVSMLKGAKLSFAVANSVDSAKEAATVVLKQTNNEDAIYHLIYDYLLKENEKNV